MCIHMCIDISTDMCVDMCVDMRMDMCMGMCMVQVRAAAGDAAVAPVLERYAWKTKGIRVNKGGQLIQ